MSVVDILCLFLFPFPNTSLSYYSLGRQEEAIRKAKELSQLATDLQHRREAREAEDTPGPVNAQYKEEVNQRLRELAELVRCGTLESSFKLVTDSDE